MSNRDLAAGVLRAWAVMWSVYVLLALPQIASAIARPSQFGDQGMANVMTSSALTIALEIIAVVFLLAKARWLSSVVFPEELALNWSLGASDFSGILFSVVGLYFMIDGFKNACGSAYLLFTTPGGAGNAGSYMWQRQPEFLVRACGGLLAGSLVFFGLGRRRGFWKSVRGAYQDNLGLQESPGDDRID